MKNTDTSRRTHSAQIFQCLCCVLMFAFFLSVASGHAAERGTLGGLSGNRAGSQAPHAQSSLSSGPSPYAIHSWQWTLFNFTASFLGLPGVVSPSSVGVDGLPDEGLGFHADGTARRADGSTDSSARFGGQRASSYLRSGLGVLQGPWLYDDIMGLSRDAQGRLVRPGSEHSGRRNQGQYGAALFGNGSDFGTSLLQRGISAGMGFANSAVESSILGLMGSDSPYGNGKARLNFMWYLDENGKSRFGGEGDVLWPLYDSLYTTVYTQIGARSMYGGGSDAGQDRWIGNFGIGQRWFPGAFINEDGKPDSGNWMLGTNAFFDYDFTRGHQRGGLGLEAQYDWLKVAANYYLPLSNWKNSQDFDGNFVQERAAEGWDVRAKGYLPFYREVAVTGSFTQWYGKNVGMFGPSKLEKDPKVWSYGLEYTPVPAMTAFVNQRQSERGRSDTEFGLRFTYHFGMGAEEQFKPSRVAEMRTVHGSRHDFVDRENKIILEYKAKNRFHIEYMAGMSDPANGIFVFRLRNGLGGYPAGATVRVSGNNVTALAAIESRSLFAQALEYVGDLLVKTAHAANLSHSYSTGAGGMFTVRTTGFTNASTLTVQAGETSQTFTAAQLGGGGSSYTFDLSALAVDNSSGNLSGTITVKNADNTLASGVAVTLSYRTAGGTGTATSTAISLGNTDASGKVTVVGTVSALERNILFSADGYSTSVTKTVGTVPAGFLTGQSLYEMNWANAKTYCADQGGKLPRINNTDSWGGGTPSSIDGFGTGGWPRALPDATYWTGTEHSGDTTFAWFVNDNGGSVYVDRGHKSNIHRVACVP